MSRSRATPTAHGLPQFLPPTSSYQNPPKADCSLKGSLRKTTGQSELEPRQGVRQACSISVIRRTFRSIDHLVEIQRTPADPTDNSKLRRHLTAEKTTTPETTSQQSTYTGTPGTQPSNAVTGQTQSLSGSLTSTAPMWIGHAPQCHQLRSWPWLDRQVTKPVIVRTFPRNGTDTDERELKTCRGLANPND
jgi:hypothetical protein